MPRLKREKDIPRKMEDAFTTSSDEYTRFRLRREKRHFGNHFSKYHKNRPNNEWRRSSKSMLIRSDKRSVSANECKFFYPNISLTEIDKCNDVSKWNLFEMVDTSPLVLTDQYKPAKRGTICENENQVVLPKYSSEYDRQILMSTRCLRRNAIHIYDQVAFKKVLSDFMAVSNNSWMMTLFDSEESGDDEEEVVENEE